jgi:hypothetical protein
MKRLRITFVAMLVAMLLATGFVPAAAPNHIALAQSVGDPADELLADAAEKMLGYDTMKFELVYEKGSTKLYTGIKMTKASGEIERPGKMRATVQTKIGFVKVNVKATVIGDKAEVRAVGIEEDYTLPSELAHIIADPVLLLPDVVGAVKEPVVTKVETVKKGRNKGEKLTWISGTFDPSLIQDEAVRGYAESLGERPVEVAIDENGLIVSVRIPGAFVSQDSKDVVRRLDIYGFGEPVEIP